MRLMRAAVVALIVAGGQLVVQAAPALACSCRADVQVAEALATSDGAFVGVLTGIDDPPTAGPIISSGRPVVNHFDVERSVKGGIGDRVDVEAAASGASCGLEVAVGQRVGLLLRRSATGWTSSLCAKAEPEALLAVATRPAAGPVPPSPEPSERGFFLALGALAVAALLGLAVLRRTKLLPSTEDA